MISGWWVKCQAPADTYSSFLSVPLYRLSVRILQEVSLDYECADYCTRGPLKPQSPSLKGLWKPKIFNKHMKRLVPMYIGQNIQSFLKMVTNSHKNPMHFSSQAMDKALAFWWLYVTVINKGLYVLADIHWHQPFLILSAENHQSSDYVWTINQRGGDMLPPHCLSNTFCKVIWNWTFLQRALQVWKTPLLMTSVSLRFEVNEKHKHWFTLCGVVWGTSLYSLLDQGW